MAKYCLIAISLLVLLLSPSLSRATQSNQSCVDEICDGLDNDCDKSIDDNVDCGPKLECGCGHCNKEMVDGKCAQGVPWNGFCLEDHCPEGSACNLKTGKCHHK